MTPNPPGNLPVPERAHPLIRTLVVEMNRQKVSMYDIADRSGVPRQTIYNWRRGTVPNAANLDAAFNVLGFRLVPMPLNHQPEMKGDKDHHE